MGQNVPEARLRVSRDVNKQCLRNELSQPASAAGAVSTRNTLLQKLGQQTAFLRANRLASACGSLVA
jgi:hypothetical protein